MTETAAADAVRYETDGPVARITLNRPDKLNAINGQVHDGILSALAPAAVAANKHLVNQVYEDAGFLRPGPPRTSAQAGQGVEPPSVRESGL